MSLVAIKAFVTEWLPTVCKVFRWFTRQQPKALRFLIIEDDQNDAERLQEFLERLGHQWEWSTSAEHAISVLPRNHFNAVFIDLRLSAMPGTEIVRQLRRSARKPKAVVVCGAPYDLEFITPSRGLHVIRKPVSLEAIEDMIGDLKL